MRAACQNNLYFSVENKHLQIRKLCSHLEMGITASVVIQQECVADIYTFSLGCLEIQKTWKGFKEGKVILS